MRPSASTLLAPVPSRKVAVEHGGGHPYRSALLVTGAGCLLATAVLLVIGVLLTHGLDGSVGRWDASVNQHLARHRTHGWNQVTAVATAAFNTEPVVLAAAVAVGLLAWRRRLAEAAFLVLALTVEITGFLSVTFVVARPRPAVHRLNSTPATGSFPSGHTAAATVLLVGLALIVVCCTPDRLARWLSTIAAFAISVLVGFSRVYRGLHHPSDVIVGFLFGLVCLIVAALAVRAARRRMGDIRTPAEERAGSAGCDAEAQKNRRTGTAAASTSR